MKKLKLSVLIPAYNVEDYIAECLDSVFVQGLSHDEFEIIVADDGSTDSTLDILFKYADSHDCVKIISHENFGLAETRNGLIDAASGDYIFFLDADDFLVPGFLSRFLEQTETEQLDLLVLQFVEKQGFNIPLVKSMQKIDTIVRTGVDYFLSGNVSVSATNKIIKRSLVDEKNIRFVKDKSYCEDLYYSSMLYFNAQRIRVVADEVYCYRIVSTSVTNDDAKQLKRLNDHLGFIKRVNDDFSRNGNLSFWAKYIFIAVRNSGFMFKTLPSLMQHKEKWCSEVTTVVRDFVRRNGLFYKYGLYLLAMTVSTELFLSSRMYLNKLKHKLKNI